MLDGDHARALACNDAVLAARRRAGEVADDPARPYHLRWVWDGTPPDGRDVLVRCYHGLGDTLQFVRYLPALRARARSVMLEVQPALAELLQGFVPAFLDGLIAFRDDAPLPPPGPDGMALEIMELGHVLRSPPPPPLRPTVPAARVAAAAGRLPGTGRSVGLCWRAGDWDPGRSVPFALLRPQLDVAGLCLVSLQRGAAGAEAGRGFVNPGDDSPDVVETAALLLGVDLVVTVDTMVAHLAGTLGVPGLVLLQASADWRWMRGDRSDWYPSLTLLRQREEGDWGPVLQALVERLGAVKEGRGSALDPPGGSASWTSAGD